MKSTNKEPKTTGSQKDTQRPMHQYSPFRDINKDWDKKKSPNDTRYKGGK